MEKTYTEKELQELLEESGNQINVAELDRRKVYIFRVRRTDGMPKDTVMNLARSLKNMLDKLSIKSIVLINDAVSIYELEKNEEKE